MQTGNIGVTTENIFPVIKKFLYSDEEIFIREIVSNAVDATQKLKSLFASGEYSGDVENLKISVRVDKVDNTITISDNGIGMTGEEIEKYINQIAFSGAEEFISKYGTDSNIIGHFGLGFYSSYIVSNTVEIITKSYKEGAVAQHWICDGSPAYTLEDTTKDAIGTDIIMHISPEFANTYIDENKIKELLTKYSRFLSVPIYLYGPDDVIIDPSTNEETIEPGKETLITDIEPLWTRKPKEITDEEYLEFYKKLYPDQQTPLFWIHLNIDSPFNLTGILYFPNVQGNVDIMRNKVYLYSNRVYVTDHVNDILPDYLTLLHGVIDSPDIPLNVSRSYLQSDRSVKQIAGYISNKVASELNRRIKADREAYEEKWPSMKIFLHYGALTQKDFYGKVKDALLIQDTDEKYYTMAEYTEKIKENQTDKNNKLIYLYAIDVNTQYSYIEAAKAKGYSVVLMTDNLSTPLINLYERETPNIGWIRVDSDIISNLIKKEEDETKSEISERDKTIINAIFNNIKYDDIKESTFVSAVSNMGEDNMPAIITANEWSRRIKEMYANQPGASFGALNYNFIININADASAIKTLIEKFNKKFGDKYDELENKIAEQKMVINDLKEASTETNPVDTTFEEETLSKYNNEQMDLIEKFSKKSDLAHEIFDIALLQIGMLHGENLNKFLKRSVKLLK